MSARSGLYRFTLAFWVYAAASASLLAPVVFWPLFAHAKLGAASLERMWLAAAACLLAAGTAVDLARTFRARGSAAVRAVLWMTGIVLGASLALKLGAPALLGALFALRTFTPAARIWQGVHDDADWISWTRDLFAAISLFFWSLAR